MYDISLTIHFDALTFLSFFISKIDFIFDITISFFDDTVSPPAFDRSGGIDYYNALSSSPDTDYLRLPLVATNLDSSNQVLFPDVNRMTFFAMSQGVVGANGKPFSDTILYDEERVVERYGLTPAQVADFKMTIDGALAAANGIVYFQTPDFALQRVNAATGSVLPAISLKGP